MINQDLDIDSSDLDFVCLDHQNSLHLKYLYYLGNVMPHYYDHSKHQKRDIKWWIPSYMKYSHRNLYWKIDHLISLSHWRNVLEHHHYLLQYMLSIVLMLMNYCLNSDKNRLVYPKDFSLPISSTIRWRISIIWTTGSAWTIIFRWSFTIDHIPFRTKCIRSFRWRFWFK